MGQLPGWDVLRLYLRLGNQYMVLLYISNSDIGSLDILSPCAFTRAHHIGHCQNAGADVRGVGGGITFSDHVIHNSLVVT